jgi:hypothetical protein
MDSGKTTTLPFKEAFMFKRIALLFLFIVMVICGANAQQVMNSTILTDTAAFTWGADEEWDTLDRLKAFSSYADATSKTYHYIIGAASSTSVIDTHPIPAAGFKSIVVTVADTNAGHGGTAAASIFSTTAADDTNFVVAPMMSTFSADAYIGSATNMYVPMNRGYSLAQSTVWSILKNTTTGVSPFSAAYVIMNVSAEDACDGTSEIIVRLSRE